MYQDKIPQSFLKAASVYKQGKNYHPQVNIKKCFDAETQKCNIFSDSDDDDGYFGV